MSYPSEGCAAANIMILLKLADDDTHHSQAYPRLGNVDKEAVLGPSPCGLYFLEGQVGPILLEMYLNDKSNSVTRNM